MAVNLNDLRIPTDSRGSRTQKPGLSFRAALRLIIAFCLGAAVVYVFLPRGAEKNTSTTDMHSDLPMPGPGRTISGEPYFTAGGWIEAPFPFPVMVSPLIEGRLDELLVWEGQKVEKDAVIARLYRRDFENALQLAEARVAAAAARLAKLEAGNRAQEIEKARAEMQEAEAQAETAKNIFAEPGTPQVGRSLERARGIG